MKEYGFDTLQVRAGFTPDAETHSNAAPIYQTTAYTFDSTEHAKSLFELKEFGNIYSRLQNPTQGMLEERMSALDGGVGALAFSSGHAAIFNTIANLADQGDEIVSSICIYGGAINMMGVTLGRLGIGVKFVDPDDMSAWEDAITDKTKAFFVELVGNPNANVADIEKIAEIAHRHGIPLIVDTTFTTAYLNRAFDFGADIIVNSITKFAGGHSVSMGGIVIDSGKFKFLDNPRFPNYNTPDVSYHGVVFAKDFAGMEFIIRLRVLMMRDFGSCLSPFNAFTFLLGLETLSLRMEKHCQNANAVAEFLEKQPCVKKVNHSVLESNKYHALQQKYLPKGSGSVFSVEFEGTRDNCAKFIDSLELLSHVANVGDTKSMVIHPGTTTHSQLTDEQLVSSGITPTTIRFSIGIEDIKDIIADIDNALKIAFD